MSTSVGKINLDLNVNKKSFEKQMSGINSLAKKTGALLAGAFGINKLVQFGKSCIDLGSDLQEVQNVVDVTFPAMSKQVDEFAKFAQTSFGLSEKMAKQYTGTFGAMAKAFGFAEEQAFEMGSALTGLAGDVASFYNLSQEEAYTKLKAVFTGETESLKDLGVVMTQTALDSYALANGFGKTVNEMTEAEKVALRYKFVQDQLSAAAGDFLRTSDGWANQVKVLNLQFDSLKATIGKGLINLFTPVLKLVNNLISRLSVLAEEFRSFTELISGKENTNSQISSTVSDTDVLADNISAVELSAKKAAKQMRDLAGIDEIQRVGSSNTDSSDSSSGSAAISNLTDNVESLNGKSVKTTWIDKILSKFNKLGKSVSTLKGSISKLVDDGLSKIFDFSVENIKSIYEDFLKPVAEWNMGEGIPRLMDVFSQLIDYVTAFIEQINWQSITSALSKLWGILADIVITIEDIAIAIIEKISPVLEPVLAGIAELFNGVLELCHVLIDDAIMPLWELIKNNLVPAIQTMIEEINIDWFVDRITSAVDAVKTILRGLTDFVQGVFTGNWSQAWAGIQQIFSGAWSAIENTAGSAKDVLVRVGSDLMGTLAEVFRPGWENIKSIFSNAWSSIRNTFNWTNVKSFFQEVWNNIKSPFINVGTWFSEKFNAAVLAIKLPFTGTSVTSFFTGVLNSIKNTFTNIPTWFRTKFQSAWTAVKNVFSAGGEVFVGITGGILSGLKTVINALITGINDVIAVPFNGLNTALKKIRDVKILGLKPFDFITTISVPEIPKLAQGGYVKANTPQLVTIGDNRHQGEVVAPENKMQEMADAAAIKAIEAIEEYMLATIKGLEAVVTAIENKDMNVNIGEDSIGEAADRYKTKKDIITGGNA